MDKATEDVEGVIFSVHLPFQDAELMQHALVCDEPVICLLNDDMKPQ